MVLARCGLDVLVVERKSHPRFVIGESTDPTTSFLLKNLAQAYGIPELEAVSHYAGLREIGCVGWPKQLFWFGVHTEGEELARNREAMLEAFPLPNGPDVHMLRADVDAFLAARMGRYGVAFEENTEVEAFERTENGVRLTVKGPNGTRDVEARLVVDATGHASFLAKRFDLRDPTPRLFTNTRSLFGHFRNVPRLDDVLGGANPTFRFLRTGGTMHHCFPGGWTWVIPFDNGVTSVGFQLDREAHPLDETLSPEEEVRALLARFPTMRAHLGSMEPARPILRTDRVQFTSKVVAGDGFVLAPHAAGFVEPLFSPGIVLTVAFVARMGRAMREAKEAGDFGPARFRRLEDLFFAETKQIDLLVNGTIQSFRDYDVFKQFWRNWVVGTLSQISTGILAGGITHERPMLYGSGLEGFPAALQEMHDMVCDRSVSARLLAAELEKRVDPWFQRVCQPVLTVRGGFGLASLDPVALLGALTQEPLVAWLRKIARDFAAHEPAVRFENAEAFLAATGKRLLDQQQRYRRSKDEDGDYHRALERILANRNPETFDYGAHVGLG
jgi:FADH2 O2-dependent halogenase